MALNFSTLISNRPRIWVALGVGTLAGIFVTSAVPPVARVLIGWNAGLWLYLILVMHMMVRASATHVQAMAAREDENAGTVLFLMSIVTVASIAAIVFELATAKDAAGFSRFAHFVLAGATVLGGWLLIPTVFTIHYARLYYAPDSTPPLTFPDEGYEPNYWDFLYFSFTIAVASQTSDVAVRAFNVRRVVLAQSLLSFFFNASVLAFSINIAASVAGG